MALIRGLDITQEIIELTKNNTIMQSLGLDQRTILVLKMRFGTLDGKKYTWVDIAAVIPSKHITYNGKPKPNGKFISPQHAWVIGYRGATKLMRYISRLTFPLNTIFY